MHVHFMTDFHNCGINSNEDPGFFADCAAAQAHCTGPLHRRTAQTHCHYRTHTGFFQL